MAVSSCLHHWLGGICIFLFKLYMYRQIVTSTANMLKEPTIGKWGTIWDNSTRLNVAKFKLYCWGYLIIDYHIKLGLIVSTTLLKSALLILKQPHRVYQAIPILMYPHTTTPSLSGPVGRTVRLMLILRNLLVTKICACGTEVHCLQLWARLDPLLCYI